VELDWSTFILEIFNFLVLIWILKRFLYRPVLNVIAQRRAAIEKQTNDAQQLHDEAEALKKQYQGRLSDWEEERRKARDKLTQELDQERARQMETLQQTLIQEREKVQAAEQRRRGEKTREIEHQALQQGAEFATKLLGMASCPELENRLIEQVIEELDKLSPHQADIIKTHWGEYPEQVSVCSAYPLNGEHKQQLERTLHKLMDQPTPIAYNEVPELKAGLQITIGAWILQANVRDELKAFTEFARAAR